MHPIYHRDGDYISKEEDAVFGGDMRKRGMLSTDGRFSYCGILVCNKVLHVFLPKTHVLSQGRSILQDARLLMDCLCKYCNQTATHEKAGEESNAGGELSHLSLAKWILQDYMRHGLYTVSAHVTTKSDSGKINWTATVRNTIPVMNQRHQCVYPALHTTSINYSIKTLITQIHQYVVGDLDSTFGWWLSGSMSGVAPMCRNVNILIDKQQAIRAINNELSVVYSDREIVLLKKLRQYLELNPESSDEDVFLSGISDFEYVWEKMCSVVFNDQSNSIAGEIPVPAYVYDGATKVSAQNKQRMDVIINDKDCIAILDAKYYDMNTTKPGWGDLVKQFYYEKSLSAVTNKKIKNYFVVPASNPAGMPEHAVVVDRRLMRLDDDFSPITILPLNVNSVMQSYINDADSERYRGLVFNG